MLPDGVVWGLTPNKRFSTKSVYQCLERNIAGSHNKWIWKAKIPLKIKIFLWQLFQNAVQTRDNLKRRKWEGSPLCSFCNQIETANHLFFSCSHARVLWGTLGTMFGASTCPNSLWQCWTWLLAYFPRGKKFHMLLLAAGCWAIWNVRNQITFEKKVVKSPMVTIFSMCAFLRYWAGLYGDDAEKVRGGADQLMQKAGDMARTTSADAWVPLVVVEKRRMITNG
jgi:hypothetical protein